MALCGAILLWLSRWTYHDNDLVKFAWEVLWAPSLPQRFVVAVDPG
jgi:hypothetical protein